MYVAIAAESHSDARAPLPAGFESYLRRRPIPKNKKWHTPALEDCPKVDWSRLILLLN